MISSSPFFCPFSLAVASTKKNKQKHKIKKPAPVIIFIDRKQEHPPHTNLRPPFSGNSVHRAFAFFYHTTAGKFWTVVKTSFLSEVDEINSTSNRHGKNVGAC